MIRIRTAPQFDSYPNSDDDFDLDSDSLNLTILAMPQSHWKNSESGNIINNAWLVACLRDLPYQPGRPLFLVRGEESGDTALVDSSTTHSTPTDRCMSHFTGKKVHLALGLTNTPTRVWTKYQTMSC